MFLPINVLPPLDYDEKKQEEWRGGGIGECLDRLEQVREQMIINKAYLLLTRRSTHTLGIYAKT